MDLIKHGVIFVSILINFSKKIIINFPYLNFLEQLVERHFGLVGDADAIVLEELDALLVDGVADEYTVQPHGVHCAVCGPAERRATF